MIDCGDDRNAISDGLKAKGEEVAFFCFGEQVSFGCVCEHDKAMDPAVDAEIDQAFLTVVINASIGVETCTENRIDAAKCHRFCDSH